MKTFKINLRPSKDITKEIWVQNRTKALKIIQNGYELYQDDDLSHLALDYLIRLLKLDGDNEYILKEDRKMFEVSNE